MSDLLTGPIWRTIFRANTCAVNKEAWQLSIPRLTLYDTSGQLSATCQLQVREYLKNTPEAAAPNPLFEQDIRITSRSPEISHN